MPRVRESEAGPARGQSRGSGAHPDRGWPLAERPSSSPRPDVGEVYTDRVLLVWKPVESYGPVTYIVQCCIEGTRWPLCPLLPGAPEAQVMLPGSTWRALAPSLLCVWGRSPLWGRSLLLSPTASPSICDQGVPGPPWPLTSSTAATSPTSCPGAACTPSGQHASARQEWALTAAPPSRSSWEGPTTWVSRSWAASGWGGWQIRTGPSCPQPLWWPLPSRESAPHSAVKAGTLWGPHPQVLHSSTPTGHESAVTFWVLGLGWVEEWFDGSVVSAVGLRRGGGTPWRSLVPPGKRPAAQMRVPTHLG